MKILSSAPGVVVIFLVIFAIIIYCEVSTGTVAVQNTMVYLIPHFYLIPILLTGNFPRWKWTFWITVLAGVHTSFLYKNTPLILSLFSFAVVGAGVESLRRYEKRKAKDEDTLNEKIKGGFDYLCRCESKLKIVNIELEKQVKDLVNLYEFSRRIAETLDLQTTLEAMRDTLSSIFVFTNSKLLLFEEKGKEVVEHFNLKVLLEEDILSITSWEKNIINTIPLNTRPLLIFNEFKRREIGLPLEIEALAVVPLVLEDRVTGLITLENVALKRGNGIGEDKSETEVADILAVLGSQFSLQIRKVKLYKRVQELSITDGLTNVYLRRHLWERFEEEIRRAKRHKLNVSLLMIDVDNFKNYNDRYGHLVGDEVLRKVAEIVRGEIREIDIVGRYGGEEFVVVLPETEKENAYWVAERIRLQVGNRSFEVYDEKTMITISVGVANFPVDTNTAQKLVDCADEALLEAKREGKNKVCQYFSG